MSCFTLPGILASDGAVAEHELAALLEGERIPILLFAAALAHVVETNDRPVGQCRINALVPVFFHPLAECRHRLREFGRTRFEFLFGLERARVFFFGRRVFALLGEREITVNRHEHVGAKGQE